MKSHARIVDRPHAAGHLTSETGLVYTLWRTPQDGSGKAFGR